MSPEDFIKKYLPHEVNEKGELMFKERDLQLLIQKKIRSKTFQLLPVPKEVEIPVSVSQQDKKQHTVTFRSDLETVTHRYEVKRCLTTEKIKEAVGGLYLYHGHGRRIMRCLSKRWVVIGLAPIDLQAYKSAKNLAAAYRLLGVEIIFINEDPRWTEESIELQQLKAGIIIGIAAVTIALFGGYTAFAAISAATRSSVEQVETINDKK